MAKPARRGNWGLSHKQEAQRFYAQLAGQEVLAGIEACGYTQWFEQMLEQMGHRFQKSHAKIAKNIPQGLKAASILQLLRHATHRLGGFPGRALTLRALPKEFFRSLLSHHHGMFVPKPGCQSSP